MLVLGSSLGALVAASELARAGLRVVLFEEETHAKRPGALREPFVLTGLGTGEPLDLLMRELSVPLLERRELVREDVALQVVLPGARIDVGGGRAALLRDLDAYGVCAPAVARRWLEEADAAGDEERAALVDGRLVASQGGLAERWGALRGHGRARTSELGAPPAELSALVVAQLAACSWLAPPALTPAGTMVLRSLRDGAFRAPHAGRRFTEIFRRRFLSSHGEIRPVGAFGLSSDGGEVSVDLPRHRLFARAALVGGPRALLARHVQEVAPAPRWLRGTPEPVQLPSYLARAERAAIPVGMASRLVYAGGDAPGDLWWLSRLPDDEDEQVEWIALRGPGAAGRPWEAPLEHLAPFSEGRIVPVTAGPTATWDVDGVDLRFPEPRQPLVLKRRPLIAAIGPEVAPELGIEGEMLIARQVADQLIERLGATPRRV